VKTAFKTPYSLQLFDLYVQCLHVESKIDVSDSETQKDECKRDVLDSEIQKDECKGDVLLQNKKFFRQISEAQDYYNRNKYKFLHELSLKQVKNAFSQLFSISKNDISEIIKIFFFI
jgi:hypothetical protein